MNTILLDSWNVFLGLYEKGGIVTLPLGLCSLVMVMVILERAWVLKVSNILPPQELALLHQVAQHDSKNLQALQPQTSHPVGRILAYGLSTLPASAQQFKEAIQDQARRELHTLARGLVILEIIVAVAPLLGLLGTALGMIQVFANLSLEGAGRSEALSQGISEALLTTVLGLSIGIPALIAFNLLSRKIESLGLQIEQEILFFYHKLFPHDGTRHAIV